MDNETLKYLGALGATIVTGMMAIFAKWNLSRLNSFDARLRDAVSTDQLNATVGALRAEIERSDQDLSSQLAEVRLSVSRELAGVRISVEKQTTLTQETSNLQGEQVQKLYRVIIDLQK